MALLLLGAGCGAARSGQQTSFGDRFGRTYYIDGAGNWGFGVKDVRQGLRRAGYRGSIINYRWSATFNPALDQTVGRVAARLRAEHLAREISAYLHRRPQNQVNIIALSAGTGVAVWACERLEPPAQVHGLILLGSSLSSHYDMSRALRNISGGVWVYYSPHDQILSGPVRALGTIDGQLAADSAGLVGLHPPCGDNGRIYNIGWSPDWARYGWSGAHTDATSEPFVRWELARHILPEMPEDSVVPEEDTVAPPGETAHATRGPETRPADPPPAQAFADGE